MILAKTTKEKVLNLLKISIRHTKGLDSKEIIMAKKFKLMKNKKTRIAQRDSYQHFLSMQKKIKNFTHNKRSRSYTLDIINIYQINLLMLNSEQYN